MPSIVWGVRNTDARFNDFKETTLQLAEGRATLFLGGKFVGKHDSQRSSSMPIGKN